MCTGAGARIITAMRVNIKSKEQEERKALVCPRITIRNLIFCPTSGIPASSISSHLILLKVNIGRRRLEKVTMNGDLLIVNDKETHRKESKTTGLYIRASSINTQPR